MRFLIFALIALSAPAQTRKTIFIVTDAEGVAGICRQEQVETKDTEMRQLLAGEVNAAVEGFLQEGAEEVVVWDGHGGSASLSTTTIHPKAKLAQGPMGIKMTFDRKYAAIAFIGQHSMANVRRGIMAHSYSSLNYQNLLMNGKPVGEIETLAVLAGIYDTPVIMLSGDQAAAAELKAIVPLAETAVVKEGLGRHSCISMSAPVARETIKEAARRAWRKMGSIPPYKVTGPVTIQIEHTTRNSLKVDADLAPGVEVLDDRTIRFKGKDFLEAWTRARGL